MDGPHTSQGTILLRRSERGQAWIARRYRTTVRQAGRWLAGDATPDGSSQALMARDRVVGCIPVDAWTTAPEAPAPAAPAPAPIPSPGASPRPKRKRAARRAPEAPAPPAPPAPVPPAPPIPSGTPPAPAGDLRASAQQELARLDQILATPDLSKAAQLAASKAKIQVIAQLSKLDGAQITEATLLGHPAQCRVLAAIRTALEPFPDALKSVAEALRALFDREGG